MTTGYGSRGTLSFFPAAFLLFAACLLGPAEASAQWTTPDASGNINNTNPGNVGVGTASPWAKFVTSRNVATPPAPQEGTIFHLINADGVKTRLTIDSFGLGAEPSVTFRFARGTAAAPSATQAGDVLGVIQGTGFGTTGFLTAAKPAVKLFATENWTDTSAGSAVTFLTTATGTTTAAERARIDQNGYFGVGTNAPLALFDLNGAHTSTSPQFQVRNGTSTGRVRVWADDSVGVEFWRNGTPTSAGNIGMNKPGAALTDDILLSTYNATTGWVERMRLLNSNGNVGIGTAAPVYKLDVAGSVNSSGLCLAGDCKTAWSQVSGGSSQWTTSGSNVYYNTGSVGIGTTTPGSQLFVGSGTPGVVALPGINVALGAGVGSYISASNNSVNTFIGADNSPYGIVGTLSNHPLGLRANNTLAVTVMPSGNVGIGTTTPGASLEIGGNPANALRTSYLNFSSNNTGAADRPYFRGTNTHLVINGYGTNTGGTLYLNYPGDLAAGQSTNTRVQETLFVSSTGSAGGGNVGVGTASPAYKLDVTGSVNSSGLCLAGDCKTAWSQVGGGSSQWTTSGTSVYYNTGSVGIGTAAPSSAKLVVGGTPGAEGLDLSTSDQYANLRVIRNSRSSFDKDIFLQYEAGAGSKIHFYSNNTESMTLSSGNLGIGTTTPTAKLDVAGDINVSGNINAKYQDVAEWVPSTQKLSAGTVVVLDAEKANHVMASTTAYDTSVAGVVSAQPGIALGEKGEGKLLVATTGRVRVKVDATRAPVKVGDLLVTSEVEGVAMKSVPVELGGVAIHRPGTIIGKALEPLAKGTGEILVLLSLQ